ncbi:hypothetical protein KUTeg_009641 [Tegillarca granosa]|uniref:Phosphatidylinositol-glycan-specific phospholipase D n=1 Tax=Tegillarca granosa TaxID=220873 RepID=A0ABQ9F9K1_TEGGR|nr:hypothetical protein KUTeg_009641 [Tegillarca granosa]
MISHQAELSFKNLINNYDYRKLISKHRDAFLTGSYYPDAFYGPTCVNEKYHDVSEDTHWAPFLNATVNYIRKLPQPWDESTEKLVVFMFGMVSHQTADILWHSLGIEQGFITTMANVNFHGVYQDSHTAADYGAETVNIYLKDFSFLKLYNKHIQWLGEEVAMKETYLKVASLSPFLVNQLDDFFLGGLDDMARWTQISWNDAIIMLQNGTRSLIVEDLDGDGNDEIIAGAPGYGKDGSPQQGRVYIIHTLGLNNQSSSFVNLDNSVYTTIIDGPYMSKYCNLGHSLAVMDVNLDGHLDLILGTPFYQEPAVQCGLSVYKGISSLRQDCSISTKDIQAVGRLHIYNIGSKLKLANSSITGKVQFDMAGYSSDLGRPYGNNWYILAVSFPGTSVAGNIGSLPFVFEHAGVVVLYNVTKDGTSLTEISRFEGDRSYGRFGQFVKFEDINSDGIDDLIIGAPLRSQDPTNLKQSYGTLSTLHVIIYMILSLFMLPYMILS